MSLPRFLQSCFPSYSLMRLNRERDKQLIITQILNYGTEKEIEWLGKNYSRREIEGVVRSPVRGMWMKSVLSYWQKILEIKLDQKVIKKAIINLNSL